MQKVNMACFAFILVFFAACQAPEANQSKDEANVKPTEQGQGKTDTMVIAQTPLDYEVQYTNWEIGNPQNTGTILELYKSWDNKDSFDVDHLFCDTLYLRLPQERHEKVIVNPQINSLFGIDRKYYKKTKNKLLSVVSLHDKESGQDWVFATLYNSWVEKSGKRDSVLLQENWLLKDGKIHTLLSFEKTPTAEFLKRDLPRMK